MSKAVRISRVGALVQDFATGLGRAQQTRGNSTVAGDLISVSAIGELVTFKTGGTITRRNQTIRWAAEDGGNNNDYYWTGSLPKDVPANSSPLTTGGISVIEGWVSTGGSTKLEEDLASPEGASKVSVADGHTLQEFYDETKTEFVQLRLDVAQEADRAKMSADEAEVYAEQAFVNGKLYPSSTAGQSDEMLEEGDYFITPSADAETAFELWQKGASSPTDTGVRTISSNYSIESRSRFSASLAESTSNPNLIDSEQAGCMVGPSRTELGGAESTVYNGKNCIRLFDTGGTNGILSDWIVPADNFSVGETITVSVVVEYAEVGNTSSLQLREFTQTFSTLETTSTTINSSGQGITHATKFSVSATKTNSATRFIGLRLSLNKRSSDDSRNVYVHSLSISRGVSQQAIVSNKGRTVEKQNIGANAVTPSAVEFVTKSINLYDKNSALRNFRLNDTTGEPEPMNSQACSDFIEVERYVPITCNESVRFWEYDEYKKPLRTNVGVTTIIPGPLTQYVRISGLSVYADLVTPSTNLILNTGNSTSDYYERFYQKVDPTLIDGALSSTRNLVPHGSMIEGFTIGATAGTANPSADNSISPFIRVKDNTEIENPVSGVTVYVAFYYKDKTFISNSLASLHGGNALVTPINAYWMRIRATNSSGNSEAVHVQYVNENKYYEPGKKANLDRLDYEVLSNKSALMAEIPTGYYHYNLGNLSPGPIPGIIQDGFSVSSFYSRYQALLDAHPEYLTKDVYGLDESGQHEVWKLTARLEPLDTVTSKKLKKVIFVTGIHGDEEVCIRGTLAFIHDLCTNWKTNPWLRWLRFNCEITFIPIANPWGFQNYSRQNANGVDVNRNFETNFTVGTPGDQTYGGPAPLSEVEGQYIDSLLSSNRDAIAAWDHHNRSAPDYEGTIWFSQNSRQGITAFDDLIARQLISEVTQDLQVNWNSPGTLWHGYTSQAYIPAVRSQASYVYGIPAATFETSRVLHGIDVNTTDIVKVSAEALGNLLLTTFKADYLYGNR